MLYICLFIIFHSIQKNHTPYNHVIYLKKKTLNSNAFPNIHCDINFFVLTFCSQELYPHTILSEAKKNRDHLYYTADGMHQHQRSPLPCIIVYSEVYHVYGRAGRVHWKQINRSVGAGGGNLIMHWASLGRRSISWDRPMPFDLH